MGVTAAELNRGNFLHHFGLFMEEVGVRTRPMGIDTSVSPNRIIYDNSSSKSLRILIQAPGIGTPSPVRNALLANDSSTLTGALKRVQSLTDKSVFMFAQLDENRQIVDSVANLHLAVVGRIKYEIEKGTRTNDSELWEHYYQAAILRSMSGDIRQTIQAVGELRVASELADSKPVSAVVAEVGAALCFRVDRIIDDDRNIETFFEAFGQAVSAWNALLEDEQHAKDLPVIIAQGIENSFPRNRHYAAVPFINASLGLYSDSPRLLVDDFVRMAWSTLAGTAVINIDEANDWYDISDNLAAAAKIAQQICTNKEHVSSLTEFRNAAEAIADSMG
jgi:hypothetical protein